MVSEEVRRIEEQSKRKRPAYSNKFKRNAVLLVG